MRPSAAPARAPDSALLHGRYGSPCTPAVFFDPSGSNEGYSRSAAGRTEISST